MTISDSFTSEHVGFVPVGIFFGSPEHFPDKRISKQNPGDMTEKSRIQLSAPDSVRILSDTPVPDTVFMLSDEDTNTTVTLN